MSSSKDEKINYDEDDELEAELLAELESIQKSRTVNSSGSSATIQPIKVTSYEPTHEVFENIVQTFEKGPQGQCILDYVRLGTEINYDLRLNNGKNYKSKIDCLDKYAVPISKLFNTNSDYIVLYRAMRTHYNLDESKGFISTSNILISKFGKHHMKIYVPTSVSVLVADITKLVNLPSQGKPVQVFEIILPRNQILIFVGKDKDNNDQVPVFEYFLAATTDEVNQKLYSVIQKDIKK